MIRIFSQSKIKNLFLFGLIVIIAIIGYIIVIPLFGHFFERINLPSISMNTPTEQQFDFTEEPNEPDALSEVNSSIHARFVQNCYENDTAPDIFKDDSTQKYIITSKYRYGCGQFGNIVSF